MTGLEPGSLKTFIDNPIFVETMMLFLLTIGYDAFPVRSDTILSNNKEKLVLEASGSLGLYVARDQCLKTFPNYTLTTDKKLDWCSNIGKDDNDHPWIQYQLPGKAMKLRAYSIRNGCCYYACCCDTETGKILNGLSCCCELYSFSLLGSNDNKTWKVIHKVEKSSYYFDYCFYQTYEFPLTESFNFVRFELDEQRPGCPRCIQINEIEFYGELVSSSYLGNIEEDSDEESISIIGKIKNSN